MLSKCAILLLVVFPSTSFLIVHHQDLKWIQHRSHFVSVQAQRHKTNAISSRLLAKRRRHALDEEELPIIERQHKLTDAMNLLGDWDEQQQTFNCMAPSQDWRGLRQKLNESERSEMRAACRTLRQEASYVLIGLNADTEAEGRIALREWLLGLDLPTPESVPYIDDICGFEYSSIDDTPDEFRQLMHGPVHIAYNSKAGADPATGDDSKAPAKAHIMPYPASDRGVVYTPILEGFFTQYGDIPLDLFSPHDSPIRSNGNDRPFQETQHVKMNQHASEDGSSYF